MPQPETPLPAYQGDGLYLSQALKYHEGPDRMSPKNRWRVLGGLGVCFAGLSAAVAFGLSIAHQEDDGGERLAAGLQPATHEIEETQASYEGYVDTLYGRQKVLIIKTGQEPTAETHDERTWSADATTLLAASIGGAAALIFAAGTAEHAISTRRNKAVAPPVQEYPDGHSEPIPEANVDTLKRMIWSPFRLSKLQSFAFSVKTRLKRIASEREQVVSAMNERVQNMSAKEFQELALSRPETGPLPPLR